MYYDTEPIDDILEMIEYHAGSLGSNFLTNLMAAAKSPMTNSIMISEEIKNLQILIYKIDMIRTSNGLKSFIAQRFKTFLELYLTGWVMLYENAEKRHDKKELTEEEEKIREKVNLFRLEEAMKVGVRAEGRLRELRSLLTYVRGNNLIEV